MELLNLFLKKFFEVLCRNLPMQNKIVFDNFGGKGFGDDPKYIALELIKRNTGAKLYWIVEDCKTPMVKGIKTIKVKSFAYIYHMMTAKIYIDNIKHSHHMMKRKGQYYIQTWHGCIALKKIEQDAYNLGQYYIINSVKHSIDIDLMYTNNDFMKNKYEKCFWYRGLVIKCDIPRISILLNPSPILKKDVYSYFNINKNDKLVIYAPTFREDYSLEPYILDYEKIYEPLKELLGADFKLLLRLHPNITNFASEITYNEHIVNASFYPDIQELLAVADVLITDFSSTMFEFGITHKPIFLICKDLDRYIHDERGLYFSINELPFKMAINEEELIENIKEFSQEEHCKRLDDFYKKVGLRDNGNGATMIADIIEEKLSNS